MLIKEEPVSPGVRGGGKGGGVGAGEAVALTSSCEVCSSEPPVLPVAMVQSVLEGRSTAASVVERRSKRPAMDRWERTKKISHIDVNHVSLSIYYVLLCVQGGGFRHGGERGYEPGGAAAAAAQEPSAE